MAIKVKENRNEEMINKVEENRNDEMMTEAIAIPSKSFLKRNK